LKGEYVRRKIDDLFIKYYSTDCMLKEYYSEDNLQTRNGLTCLNKLEKNELVAIFSSDIRPESHYIKHSDKPNCYLEGHKVLTLECIQPFNELTIKYE
jgi:hypothetical protein